MWIGLPGVLVAVLIGMTASLVATYRVFPSGVIAAYPLKRRWIGLPGWWQS
jgi:hypothetical protein